MSEDFEDYLMDSKLKIQTVGRNDHHSDTHRYPYEATTYSVLERVMEEEYLTQEDTVLDYGCGLGRVPIYFHYRTGCRAQGIELVEEFYVKSLENLKQYGHEDEVRLFCGQAEEFEVSDEVSACFFFNPFDVGILRGVMKQILTSYEKAPRQIRLFFYYPQDEYMGYLSTIPELDFVDEIDCTDLFSKQDDRNRIMIFELS